MQQHFVEAAQLHHRTVVALHELLHRQRIGGIFIAQRFRQFDLVVEQQPVLAAAHQQVQGKPDSPEERAAGSQDS